MNLTLNWQPDTVAQIMADHGIRNRFDLARRLEPIGIGKSSVFRAFDENWRGNPSVTLLAAMCRLFGAPLGAVAAVAR